MSRMSRVLVALVLVAAVAAAFLWWRTARDTSTAPAPVASAPAPAPVASAPPASDTGVKHRIDETASPLDAGGVTQALTELLGQRAVASFLRTDDFARRVAATVDNLGREHAPASMWPLNPSSGRFTVEEHEGAPVIAADNAARYTPLVLLAESVDAKRAADLYVRMYPMLQRAYEELGYPKRHFNDRLIEVIDLLLAAPQPEYPVPLRLMEVKGPIPSERPWVRYEYADPALQSLSAGQRILVRVGAANARRLKAKLSEIRRELVRREGAR